MRPRSIVLLGILAAGAAAGVYLLWGRPKVDDPFALDLPSTEPTGAPVEVRRLVSNGDVFRTTGTFSYTQRTTGSRGRESTIPSKDIRGTVEAIRRVLPDVGGLLQSSVEVWMDLKDVEGSADPRPRKEHFQFRFRESAQGGAVHGERRLEGVGQDLASYLETLVGAFAEGPLLPERGVRVGEAFEPDQVVDVDPFRARMWIHFRQRDQALPPAVGPLLGRVWVEARERRNDEDVLRVRSSIRHAFAGEATSKGQKAMQVDYRSAVEAVKRVAVGDGVARTYDVDWKMRVGVKASDLDYVVETEEHTAVATTRDTPK